MATPDDPNYRYSVNEYTTTGSQTEFEISFAGGYLLKEYVKVRWTDSEGGVFTPSFSFVNDFTISIVPALAAGGRLMIYRDTPADFPVVDFADSSVINEQTLDTNAKQAVHLAAETRDIVGSIPSLEVLQETQTALAFASNRANHTGQQDIGTVIGLPELAAANQTFPNTAAGIAATRNGIEFDVIVGGNVNTYRNQGGSAVLVSAVPTTNQLASANGASQIGTPSGNLSDVIQQSASPLNRAGVKPFARSWAEAIAMCDDHSEMRGYAKEALTTGGAGKPIYKVWNARDDQREGSLRWALAQAATSDGGRIIFVPVGKFTITVKSLINLTANNITIDAPGRNVTLLAANDIEMVRFSGINQIFRRISLARLPGLTHIDGDNIYEKDALSVNPITADRIWVDQCTGTEHSDGFMDVASSLLVPETPVCRVTMSRCLVRRQDKGMAIGTSATSVDPAPAWAATALDQPVRVFVTYDRNVFDGVAQRSPRVGGLAFVHKINNLHFLTPYFRDNGLSSACYATIATTGGKVRSEGDLARLLWPVPGEGTAYGFYADTAAWNDTTNLGPGAMRIVGSVSEAGLTSFEANTAKVPVPTYTYTAETVPAVGVARDNWVTKRLQEAGAERSSWTDTAYVFVTEADAASRGLYPDGYNVVAVQGGYRVRTVDTVDAPLLETDLAPTSLSFTRGSTLRILGGDITLGNSMFFAVDTEDNAATDDLVNIFGGVTGQVIGLRPASASRKIVVKGTGNIKTPRDVTLANNGDTMWLMFDSGIGGWSVVAAPVGNLSGVYNATAVAGLNCTSAVPTANVMYVQAGSVVTVTGIVTVTATAASECRFTLSLPVPSDLTATSDLSGLLTPYGAGPHGAAQAVAADDVAGFRFVADAAATARIFSFTFTYRVK